MPPLDSSEPPSLGYPSRGIATLWAPPSQPDPTALVDLLGRTRALLLQMLGEPLPTIEIARRLKVTASAVSQHLRVLHATGLVTRARDRRHVLYRRTPTGAQLANGRGRHGGMMREAGWGALADRRVADSEDLTRMQQVLQSRCRLCIAAPLGRWARPASAGPP